MPGLKEKICKRKRKVSELYMTNIMAFTVAQ